MVVRLKRNLHCFKRGFYGEFIPDSRACGGGEGFPKNASAFLGKPGVGLMNAAAMLMIVCFVIAA